MEASICVVVVILLNLRLSSADGTTECGKRPPMPRVIGGAKASPHSWPWQAEILKYGLPTQGGGEREWAWDHKCGGSLIHREWIITAAHCLSQNPDPRIYRIILGVHDRSQEESMRQYFDVSQLYIHKRFQTDTGYGHDIALIRLSRPAVLNRGVGLVCLPKQNQRVEVGKVCYLTGWGVYQSGGSDNKSETLRQAKIPIVSHERCSKGNSFFQPVHDESMICAGFGRADSKVSGCNGDSGGPLSCSENGKFVLRGAVSWGIPSCPAGETFSVFARISSFVDWVNDHIKNSDMY